MFGTRDTRRWMDTHRSLEKGTGKSFTWARQARHSRAQLFAMTHEVICSKVDLDSDGQVTWTWDPFIRMLSISQGAKGRLGPNLIHVSYERRITSAICLLGSDDQGFAASTASFLAGCILKPKDESNLEPDDKKQLMVSLSVPSLYSKPAAMRKIRESIAEKLAV